MRQRASFIAFRRAWIGLLACGVILLSSSPIEAAENRFAFSVQLSLSRKAAARLAATSEAIIVSASYSGNPIPAAEKEADEIGQIDLGIENVEAPGKDGTVYVTGTKVNRDRLRWLKGPVLLNVNVYSARRSGPDNILACDFFDGKLEDAVRKPLSLHCSLITENAKTRHTS